MGEGWTTPQREAAPIPDGRRQNVPSEKFTRDNERTHATNAKDASASLNADVGHGDRPSTAINLRSGEHSGITINTPVTVVRVADVVVDVMRPRNSTPSVATTTPIKSEQLRPP